MGLASLPSGYCREVFLAHGTALWQRAAWLAEPPPAPILDPGGRRRWGLHHLAQRSCEVHVSGADAQDSAEVQGWGPGCLQAAPKGHSYPGRCSVASRAAAQPSGTSPPGRLHRRVCRVCQLVPGPGSLPGDLVSGNRRNLGAAPATSPSSGDVLLSARHLQLSPAVSLLTIPIPLLGTLPWEQRDPGASDVPARAEEGLVLRGGCAAGLEGLGGRKDHGSIPEAWSHDPGSVSPMLHAGKNYRLRPESPATHAVFLVQRYEFLPAQGTAFISTPSQLLLGNTPLRCSVQGLQLLMIPAFTQQPRWQWVLSPGQLTGTICCPGAFSPLSPSAACRWQMAWMEKRAGVGWRPLGARVASAVLLSGSGCGCSPHTSVKCKQGGAPTTQSCTGCTGTNAAGSTDPGEGFLLSPSPLHPLVGRQPAMGAQHRLLPGSAALMRSSFPALAPCL